MRSGRQARLRGKGALRQAKERAKPDTVFRVEIPVEDLEPYIKYGMDKEFWQSAERVEDI